MATTTARSAWRAVVPVLLGAAIWLTPVPQGLSAGAWSYFALFAAVIAALITEPLPGSVIGVLGITLTAALRLVAPTASGSAAWALSGFSNSTVWLIFLAFMLGLGYERTGLGRRIALTLVRGLGHQTLGLGYAVALADFSLAPFIPSNTARSGGTIFPIIRHIPALYDSAPGGTPRRIGAYLMWTAFAATGVTSSMFLTANAANLFAVAVMQETVKIRVGWTDWAMGFLPVGTILFIAVPVLAYVLYPPSVRSSREVPTWAGRELAKMGPMTRGELTMAAIAALALMLWISGGAWLSPTTVALTAFGLMLVTGVLDWADVLGNRDAWNVLIWFATLVTLADGLNVTGFLPWFAGRAAAALAGIPATATLVLLVAMFFVAHYLFASLTAHATALLPVFLAAGALVPGMRLRVLALALCYAVGLMGVLTPYATGPAPIYFASGYISRKAFWTLGLVFGAIYLLALLAIGVPYLFTLGP